MKVKLFPSILGFIALTTLWQLIEIFDRTEHSIVPAPVDVAQTLVRLFTGGDIWEHLFVSLFRFGGGYITAIIVAITLGLLLGRMEKLWFIIDPIVQVLRPVSPVAWSPFIVLWFGIGHLSIMVIIFFAAFFPILLSTVAAVRKVEPIYLAVAANFELSKWKTLSKVVFPAAFPAIANGLRMAIGSAWIFLVTGEMVGTDVGLGYLIVSSKEAFQYDVVLALIMILGFLGFLIDKGIRVGEQQLITSWGKGPQPRLLRKEATRNATNHEHESKPTS